MTASTGGKYVQASAYGNRTLHTVSSCTSDGGSFPELRARTSSTDPIGSTSQKRHFALAIGSNIHDASLQSQIPKLRRQLSGAVAADIRRTVDAISSRDPSNGELAGSTAPKYFKYSKSGGEQAAAQSRVIKLHEVVSDPLEPAHIKLKKMPPAHSSPPSTVLHSPPRALTESERAQWNIPPSISNWKNSKGYTIPLDKRLAADGRGLQTTRINDSFAKLSEVCTDGTFSTFF